MHAAGIWSIRHLLRAVRQSEWLDRLVRATGLPPEVLQDLARRAELSQIWGIGPKAIGQLLAVGVASVPSLASQEPLALQQQLRRLADHPPNLAIIEHWIAQAQRKRADR